jgi:hypothetical protein
MRKRAADICISSDYDGETREAISNAIAVDDPNLAEMVRRAESGETILDITGEYKRSGLAALDEVERLAKEAVGNDNRKGSFALLRLFTLIIRSEPLVGLALASRARMAVIRASDELIDEAGDLLMKEASNG